MLTFNCHSNRRSRRRHSASRCLRPPLEELESRLVPSSLGGADHHVCEWQNLKQAGPVVKLDLVALHEFGHSWGLSHTDAPGSIMGPFYSPVANYNKANLASDPAVIVDPNDNYSSLLELFSDAAVAANTTSWKDSLDSRPGNGVVELTYSFMPDGVHVDHSGLRGAGPRNTIFATLNRIFGAGNWQPIFAGELNRWASVSNGNLSFRQVSDNGGAFGSGAEQNDPNFGDIRIATHRFDNAGNVLAHAYPPPHNGASAAGDAHFDEAENWINGGALVTNSGHGQGHGGGASLGGPSGGWRMPVGASGTAIWLDDNAAAWGWFVEPTPWEDAEFDRPGDRGEQGRMDPLTVLAHELGYLLGQGHDEDGVRAETLAAGTRLVPLADSPTDWLAALDGVFAADGFSDK